jgi:hypothetical protein
MLPTYKAILTKDRVQWQDEAPATETPASVMITFLEAAPTTPKESDGQKMAEALCEIATRGGLSELGDAGEWQREQRQGRPLPGRGE